MTEIPLPPRLVLLAVLSLSSAYFLCKSRRRLVSRRIPSTQNPSPNPNPRPKLFFASHTGTAESLARSLAARLHSANLPVDLVDPRHYEPEDLAKESIVIIVTSTWEDGKPPPSAAFLARWLTETSSDFRAGSLLLSKCQFAVFGVGSGAYGENFNAAARDFVRWMRMLGAAEMVPVGEGDVDQGDVDEVFGVWSGRVVGLMSGEVPGVEKLLDTLLDSDEYGESEEEMVESVVVDLEDLAGKAPRKYSGARANGVLANGDSGPKEMVTSVLRTILEKQISTPIPMEDDDDFGDLYSDVLLPLPTTAHPPSPPPAVPAANPVIDALLDDDEDDDLILYGPAPVDAGSLTDPATGVAGDPVRNPSLPAPDLPDSLVPDAVPAVGARVSDGPVEVGDPFLGGESEIEIDIGDAFDEQPIPGLSAGPLDDGRRDDTDSDSEDDLQIVLNESDPVRPLGVGLGEDDDDEDGEEDLVIVTDEQQPIHRLEEQDWGEEAAVPAADGERKDAADAGKVNGAVAGVAGARIGYGGHGFNPQHHSMYKYIRPGASPVPGGPVVGTLGGPGQIRPPAPLGPAAGRGRGDWRPAVGRGIPNGPRGFNPGYGLPGWANNTSGRGFGSGLDFTLPSHKTAFDIDIESFDEKPWRYPGVDTSDFFNFGLDEDNWKSYCKQLEQLRLESTMQSKIRVYEGGRSEPGYDPELPPELVVASAAGQHDGPEIVQYGKLDSGQVDLNGLGVAGGMPLQMPIGRAIPVENGYGERLPSSDTRQSRFRDSDATIEIVLQGSLNDSPTCNGEQPEKELQGDSKDSHDFEEDDKDDESDPRESLTRKAPSVTEDGILPSPRDSPHQYNPNSKIRSPGDIGGPPITHRGGRLPKGTSHGGRHESPQIPRRNYREHSIDGSSGRNAQSRHDSPQIEQPRGSFEGNQTSEASPAHTVSPTRELSLEQSDSEHDDRLALGDSIDVGEDIAPEFLDDPGDDSLDHSSRKQKLSSQVEQSAVQENGMKGSLRPTHSDDSRAKSGSSKEYPKRREGDEEVLQGGHSRRTGDSRKRTEEERNTRRKDDYGRDVRHEKDRSRTASKGREMLHHSYPHKDWDSTSAHHARGRSEAFDRPNQMDGRQRRENAIHSRRLKDEDTRRERNDETRLKNRYKVKVGESNGKDEDIHLKKRVDDGDLRGRHREGSSRPRERERDDMLMRRRENLDEPPNKKGKAEEHPRRGKTDRENSLHGHSRAREDLNRRKREKDDGADHRRREDDTRIRDKTEDRQSIKPRDDTWRQREREDRQRLKQSHKDPQTHHARDEGRTTIRNGRTAEDKLLAGNGKNKDDSKGLGSDKDYQHKDRRRQNEQLKRVDRSMDGNDSQHRGREDVHARKKQISNDDKSPRPEKMTSHSDRHSNASDSQQMPGEKPREYTRKSKDAEASEQNLHSLGKRKYEEDNTHQKGKASRKDSSEQGHNGTDGNPDASQPIHPSGKFGEDDPVSDDESQKGRSKLERWTSHKERDYTALVKIQSLPSSSIAVEGAHIELMQTDESAKTEGNNVDDSEFKGVDAGQHADQMGDDQDRHHDTVAKLKKRSERFKLAMPGEKDTVPNKKVETEAQLTQNDAAASAADSDIKTERPARKRRWIGS